MIQTTKKITLQEFLALPETDINYELIEGKAVPKISPKGFHAAVQAALLILIQLWCKGKGRIYPKWAIILKRNGEDLTPIPDLTYISYNLLSADWMLDEACPIPPELVIEIISPGQSFGDLAEKATDYLQAGVLRVWVVDSHARSITVFYPDRQPQTFKGTVMLTDQLLPGLQLTAQQVLQQAELPGKISDI